MFRIAVQNRRLFGQTRGIRGRLFGIVLCHYCISCSVEYDCYVRNTKRLVFCFKESEVFKHIRYTYTSMFFFCQKDSPNILIDFISNIPNVVNDLGPESLVVVTSEKVGMQYVQLLQ